MSRDYYAEINDALNRIEHGLYETHSIDWVITRIDWTWKWRKITESQKDELCERAIAILEQRR